jgi:S1-C subfamily serine protease
MHRFAPIVALTVLCVATVACSLPVFTNPQLTPTTMPTPTLVATLVAAPTTPTTMPTLTPVPALVAAPTATAAPAQATPEPTASLAMALQAEVEAVYKQAGPAVVNITSQVIAYDVFMQPVPQEGTGSGFIYDTQGNIVTNYHVVADAESISVALAGANVYTATVVGTDPSNDLAVVHIDAQNLPDPIPLADSSELEVGQFVVAIGSPFALSRTLTFGVISALGRVIQSPDQRFIGEAIQTDAAINPGNSGGPLLDLEGRVVGVNSQIISPSGSSAGIGFAVSSNTVRRVVPALIAEGHYPHPALGVTLLPFSADGASVLRQAGMEVLVDAGLLIVDVTSNGPAAQAGLRGSDREVTVGNARIPVGGDIIVGINGQTITTFEDLNVYLETQTQVGDTVNVDIIRDGQQAVVPVTLAERTE